MEELGNAFDLQWGDQGGGRLGEWTTRHVRSVGTTPFVEIIQGSEGSPWHAHSGSRVDHLALRSSDPGRQRRRLESLGMPVTFDFWPYGLKCTYHEAIHSGIRIEVVNQLGPTAQR